MLTEEEEEEEEQLAVKISGFCFMHVDSVVISISIQKTKLTFSRPVFPLCARPCRLIGDVHQTSLLASAS